MRLGPPFIVETLVFLATILLVFVYLLLLLVSNPPLFSETLPELIAGVLGIFMGFAITRWIGFFRDWGRAKEVLKYIKRELNYNIEVIKIGKEITSGTFLHPSFKLFKTHIWNVFNQDLRVLWNTGLILDLGELYHELSSLNEAMKLSPVDDQFLPKTKQGWDKISKQIQDLIDRIDKELNRIQL